MVRNQNRAESNEIQNIVSYAREYYGEFVASHPIPADKLAKESDAQEFVWDMEEKFLDDVAQHFGWSDGWDMLSSLDADYYGYDDEGAEVKWKLFQWISDDYVAMMPEYDESGNMIADDDVEVVDNNKQLHHAIKYKLFGYRISTNSYMFKSLFDTFKEAMSWLDAENGRWSVKGHKWAVGKRYPILDKVHGCVYEWDDNEHKHIVTRKFDKNMVPDFLDCYNYWILCEIEHSYYA